MVHYFYYIIYLQFNVYNGIRKYFDDFRCISALEKYIGFLTGIHILPSLILLIQTYYQLKLIGKLKTHTA